MTSWTVDRCVIVCESHLWTRDSRPVYTVTVSTCCTAHASLVRLTEPLAKLACSSDANVWVTDRSSGAALTGSCARIIIFSTVSGTGGKGARPRRCLAVWGLVTEHITIGRVLVGLTGFFSHGDGVTLIV